MAHPRSEKYKSIDLGYSQPGKDHWRPIGYNKRKAKGSESGKADRCKRKAAWFVGHDGARYDSRDTARSPGHRELKARGYVARANREWHKAGSPVVIW